MKMLYISRRPCTRIHDLMRGQHLIIDLNVLRTHKPEEKGKQSKSSISNIFMVAPVGSQGNLSKQPWTFQSGQ